MALLANIHRNPKKQQQPFEPIEFLPQHMKPKQEPADPGAVFEALRMAFLANQPRKEPELRKKT